MKKETLSVLVIPPADVMSFLPSMFDVRCMSRGEALLNHFARTFAEDDYKGGTWDFKRVSNGAHYAAPSNPERLTVCIVGNQFERSMSRDAAGILISLFVLGALSSEADAEDLMEFLAERYHQLYDFAKEHAEWPAIRAAID